MDIKKYFTILVSIFLLNGCTPQKTPQEFESVRIGLPLAPITSMLWIAQANGYFKEEGLNAAFKVYPNGKKSMEGMFNNEVDVFVSSETPFVFNSFKREDFLLVATMASTDKELKVIARKDLGVYKVQDLRNKKIGVPRAVAGHFFLDTFLKKHDLFESSTIVFMKQPQLPEALIQGEIDAFAARNPYNQQAKDALGEKITEIADPGLYRKTFNLATSKAFAAQNPEVLRKIIKALLKTERFIKEHQRESIAIMSGKMKIEAKNIAAVWKEFIFKVSLDQSLLTSMEDEARWIIQSGFEEAKVVNYLDIISLDPLREIKPETVTIY